MNSPERGDPDKLRIVQGISEAGIDMKGQGARTSRAEREAAAEHIKRTLRDGYLKEDDAERRLGYIDRSDVRDHLVGVTHDLPPLPMQRESVRRLLVSRFDWKERVTFVPVLLSTLIVGLLTAIVPSAVMQYHGMIAIGVSTATLIVGAVVTVASAVMMAVKLDNYSTMVKKRERGADRSGYGY